VWVGAHQNIMVAIFAIDSLRQLADKFLKISDFQSFSFQKDFLSPFEQIMLQNMHTRSEIKDYIVCCIVSICATKTTYIKSGWSVIINIFTLAAQDSEKDLVEKSFEALKKAI
jgi:brefeldin A-inhibited guanine nucleotide-exchange protein